jgi:vacuolar-type H+-ATPase subunit F/Vma7
MATAWKPCTGSCCHEEARVRGRATAGGNPAQEIAVLADPELVDALRLAGVGRSEALRAHEVAAQRVREILADWLADEAIAVIVIGVAHARLVAAELAEHRHSRRARPVLVQVPSLGDGGERAAADYYHELGREFLGLEIVLQGSETVNSKAGPG